MGYLSCWCGNASSASRLELMEARLRVRARGADKCIAGASQHPRGFLLVGELVLVSDFLIELYGATACFLRMLLLVAPAPLQPQQAQPSLPPTVLPGLTNLLNRRTSSLRRQPTAAACW